MRCFVNAKERILSLFCVIILNTLKNNVQRFRARRDCIKIKLHPI